MSNIGKRLIQIPKNVTINISESVAIKSKKIAMDPVKIITIQGPLGISKLNIPNGLQITLLEDTIQNNKSISISQANTSKKNHENHEDQETITFNKIWGTFRSIIANTIIGVSQGFQVNLKIVGVGYRASVENKKNLVLKLGFSHLINLEIPKTITVSCPKPTRLILRSNNLSELMQYAARIRSYKEPEPYKGKGILYKGEKICRKEGKKK